MIEKAKAKKKRSKKARTPSPETAENEEKSYQNQVDNLGETEVEKKD